MRKVRFLLNFRRFPPMAGVMLAAVCDELAKIARNAFLLL
jgi:hypothetical protein